MTDLLHHGVPSHKIVIGLPAYGWIVKLNAAPTSANMGIGQGLAPRLTAQGTANQGAGLWNGEFVGDYFTQNGSSGSDYVGSTTFDYKCLVAAEQSGSTIDPSSSDPNCHFTNPQAGNTAGAFISYDNEISASIKANYVKNAGLGGMMMWEIDGDIAPTATNFKTKSLVYSMYNCFHSNVCTSAS